MAIPKGVTPERRDLILSRQQDWQWGDVYVPSIMATKEEAPPGSRPSGLSFNKFGREIQLLSEPERFVTLVALHHPNLIDLHEEKMLPTSASPHPLEGHPTMVGKFLPPMRGTVVISEELDCLDLHPKVSVPDPREPDTKMWVPFPYIGDLLLVMAGQQGTYCINWTVKNGEEDFSRTQTLNRRRKNSELDARKAIARHQIEDLNYRDAGIRTVRVTRDTFDIRVVINLQTCFGYLKQELTLSDEQREEIIDKFRTAMDLGIPGNEVIQILTERGRYSPHECRTVLYQALWNRTIRIDLFSPILINLPLKPEQRDVLEVYSSFFEEK